MKDLREKELEQEADLALTRIEIELRAGKIGQAAALAHAFRAGLEFARKTQELQDSKA